MPNGRRARGAVAIVLALSALVPTAMSSAGAAETGPAEASSSDWRQVSAGGFHTCGIRTNGRLYCWGWDDFKQLGDGASEDDMATPTLVAGGFTDWASVSAGGLHTCARRSTGQVYCWGDDSAGQLGNGATTTGFSGTPVAVAGTWASVSAGSVHTCARRSTGRLFCWGADNLGQLGNGPTTTTNQAAPVEVAGARTDWTAFAAGGYRTCARRSSGRLFCWGSDEFGALGDGGMPADKAAPVEVAGGVTTWTGVTVGADHTCARRSTGRLFCWGSDNLGQLGNGATTGEQPAPVQVAGGRTDWTLVEAGDLHTCARRTSGQLFCWGNDTGGKLGDGGTETDQPAPVEVAGGATDWAAVAGGGTHMCARTRGSNPAFGRLYCWGADYFGQVGDGPAIVANLEPVEVRLA